MEDEKKPKVEPEPAEDQLQELIASLSADEPEPGKTSSEKSAWTRENVFKDSARPSEGDAVLQEQLELERQRYRRLVADFDNFKKRIRKERDLVLLYANETLLQDILPVYDDLCRALKQNTQGLDPNVVGGLEMIRKRLLGILAKTGAEPFESLNQVFDPTRHDAVATYPMPDLEPGTVIEEIEQGFFFHSRLLRPAKVVVNSIQAKAPAPNLEQLLTEGDEDLFQGENTGEYNPEEQTQVDLPEVDEATGAGGEFDEFEQEDTQ